MTSPQAFPIPLWPLSLFCPLQVWPVQSIASPEDGSGFRIPEIQQHLLWTQVEQQSQKIFLPTPKQHMAQETHAQFLEHRKFRPGYQDLSFANSLFPSVLDFQRTNFSCSSSSDYADQVTAYRISIVHHVWNLWEKDFQYSEWWTIGGSGTSLGELPLSPQTLQPVCNQHALLLAYLYIPVWDAPDTL